MSSMGGRGGMDPVGAELSLLRECITPAVEAMLRDDYEELW